MNAVELQLSWHRISAKEGRPYLYPDSITDYMKRSYSYALVYRWATYRGNRLAAVYVGEAENLITRINGYRSPGVSQITNKRIQSFIKYEQVNRNQVFLEVLDFEPFKLFRTLVKNPLSDPYVRKTMENIAILSHDPANCQIWNLAGNPIERRLRRGMKAEAAGA